MRASNDVHYVEQEHWKAHDCLICIGTQSQLSDPKRMRYQESQFYLRTAEEMAARFAEVPEAARNTLEVADRCNLEIKFGRARNTIRCSSRPGPGRGRATCGCCCAKD